MGNRKSMRKSMNTKKLYPTDFVVYLTIRRRGGFSNFGRIMERSGPGGGSTVMK
jgi:hypothetical protein